MGGSSHFKVPHTPTDAVEFLPITKLPDHLAKYEKTGKKLRANMTPMMQLALDFTDKIALRSAAMSQSQ